MKMSDVSGLGVSISISLLLWLVLFTLASYARFYTCCAAIACRAAVKLFFAFESHSVSLAFHAILCVRALCAYNGSDGAAYTRAEKKLQPHTHTQPRHCATHPSRIVNDRALI